MSEFFLADDLSGALDAAAGFHGAGRRVTVALTLGAWSRDAGVVTGVTTETRNAPPEIAAATVTAAMAEGQRRGARLLYKKIDSTLRGPVVAELRAVLAALPGTRVLFCPANPAAGRTVRDGVLRVHGVPVAETEFARDPLSPVRESAIPAMLGDLAGERVTVADAETEADLAAAVAAMEQEKRPWVGVGSGALARAVARNFRREAIPPTIAAGAATGPILMVCASAHPGNRAQIAAVARERGVTVHEVSAREPERAVREAVGPLRAAGAAVLVFEAARTDSGAALAAMTTAATRLAELAGVRRMFITGGETAFALCGALGVRELEFGAEIEAGVALARSGAWWLAVKPGGFGDAGTWVRALDRLRAN